MNVSLVISKQRLRLQPQQGRESVNSPSLRGLIREGDRPNERPCILRSSLNFYTYGRPYRVWVRAQNQAEVLGEEEEEEISWVGEENSTVAVLVDGKSGVRRWFSVLFTRIKLFAETQEVRVAAQIVQFTCSIIYVGLYILGTYSPAPRGSMRYILELMLCLMFAGEFMYRFFVNHPDAGSKFRMLTAPINIFDLLSFTPMLLEVLLQQFIPHFTLGRFDLKWAKLFRSLRVMRVGLLAGELRSMHLSTKRGHWLSAGANFKLIQLAASPIVLLFMASAVIQIVEHIPFHKAVYFVATTLSTVGYGDVVAISVVGQACVVAMIAIGIVLIPVQAAAFYNEVSARRTVKGSLPDWRGKPFVLLSTRLTEVRAFSDMFAEFQQALGSSSQFPMGTKIVALCNRPSFEFTAFQELHERALTLVEGSAVSGQDLVTAKAERAKAIMLLADRFTNDPENEDLGILFQVWAAKSYTKTVPLFVQTLKQATVDQIKPFLDPGQDVAVSAEETRFRMLALSASCPGASTFIGNLIRSSSVKPREARGEKMAGRKWLRQYVDGCEAILCRAPVQRHLVGEVFLNVAEWLYRTSGCAIIGIIDPDGRVALNPSDWKLAMGYTLLVMGPSTKKVRKALSNPVDALKPLVKEKFCSWVAETYPWSHYEGNKNDSEGEDSDGEYCIPVIEGFPESESVELEDFPCIPREWATKLNTPELMRAFFAEYAKDADALDEQHAQGNVSMETTLRICSKIGVYDEPSVKPRVSSELARSPVTQRTELKNHYIVCGHAGSFFQFMSYLRAAEPASSPTIVILHPEKPSDFEMAQRFAPVQFIQGCPTHAESLKRAGASTARALVFLTKGSREVKTAQATGGTTETRAHNREAVLFDAPALLSCYGVGEQSGPTLTHAVVELLFTTSIEFLQPGLLLKGVNSIYDESNVPSNVPRKSWSMRALQQREAVLEGLTEWQSNPYYAAGRCTVPALMDTFATQGFFSRGLLIDILAELSGDFHADAFASEDSESSSDTEGFISSRSHHSWTKGAMLVQVAVPSTMAGRTFGECFSALALSRGIIPIGLYRRKLENPATRLSYVMTLPPPDEIIEKTDKFYILRRRSISMVGEI